jgi:hypothetical protein
MVRKAVMEVGLREKNFLKNPFIVEAPKDGLKRREKNPFTYTVLHP